MLQKHQLRLVRRSARGMTLLELIIACSILIILASAAVPIARYSMVRAKERELRNDLRDMKDAVDRYKELADRHQIKAEIGSLGYPPSLEALVKGVSLGPGVSASPGSGGEGSRIRFLRKIPVDPMTGQADWGLRCVTDAPDATIWCGKTVFDVYSKSQGTALDGTKYSDW